MKELEKCECVLSVMNVAPILNIDKEKMGTMGILLVIDVCVYICICKVYSSNIKEYTQKHSSLTVIFQYYRRVNAVVQSSIIDHMRPSVYWMEKTGKKVSLKNMLSKFFDGNCIVEYDFKVTANNFS